MARQTGGGRNPLTGRDCVAVARPGSIDVRSFRKGAHMSARKLLLVLLFLSLTQTASAAINANRNRINKGTQIEPKAGKWQTWVISSGKDFRVPPPPGHAATLDELDEVAAL